MQPGCLLVVCPACGARQPIVKPSSAERLKLLGAVGMLAAAFLGFYRFYRSGSPDEGKAYYYDLSGKKLFVGPHDSVPPIRGVIGDEVDGVLAIVISSSGDCNDAASRKIAYLETYAPELKRQIELRKGHEESAMDPVENPIRRGEAHQFILVKRPEEAEWHAMNTPEAQAILQIINTPGPDGRLPVVCIP